MFRIYAFRILGVVALPVMVGEIVGFFYGWLAAIATICVLTAIITAGIAGFFLRDFLESTQQTRRY